MVVKDVLAWINFRVCLSEPSNVAKTVSRSFCCFVHH